MEPIPVDLSGVPQTLLWNLGRRAAAARAARSPLDDPLAIEVAGRLEYDFPAAARGASWHAVRVATFDGAVRRFLAEHPAGQVVALGEGLETQFWRVDNGRVSWLTVDLPETLALRRQVLPDGPRQRSHAGSALELNWLDELDPAAPVLVTAQGLFPYFERSQVHELIAALAGLFPARCSSSTSCRRRCSSSRGGRQDQSATRRSSSGRGRSTRKSARRSARSPGSPALRISCRRARRD